MNETIIRQIIREELRAILSDKPVEPVNNSTTPNRRSSQQHHKHHPGDRHTSTC